ncbi:UNC93-like protein [Ostrinia furnacalis]|uniref:UNC93-like protein n=1 Tax=Ostrinia furnacalis TaxID=93504 RepID=UPI00103AD9DE|nr:UNC93-like protein [Ostrinia furnacalis]XP_028156752.1 UNC93-like protein [Ostrinia furnacalis]XP_028156753.1 UNC93-like protein [Ostrinia furnacalis]XP_028156754.1 UNC93-like protein [Ostrinia furnacalis]XP_028156755.1 UNC93-like protein [Ostrinia furnacalis]XP_028156757.1 UNC93-like protein [Ostrinia furnacalis]XP_028156758.1 UNC93-like protein [Ostrinia furnacalis]
MTIKDDKPTEFGPREKWRILKNVLLISFAFMAEFTAYSGAANLQSSINSQAGLGTASLTAVYAGLIFSTIFLPVMVIKWLGPKWAISLSFVTYMPYIAAQMYPSFWTLIPAALLLGLGGGPLWCSKCTYLSMIAEAHSKISNISAEALLTRYLGLFFMIYQMSQVWGNLISSLVLTAGDNEAAVTAVNASMIPEVCGANFLPAADAGHAFRQQPPERIQMMIGIYLACMAGAAITVAVGVDSMKRYDTGRSSASKSLSGMSLLVVTAKLLVEPNQLLLVLLNTFVGFQLAFFTADFTAAFVSCAVGTGIVGFVTMTLGLANAISCAVTGYIAKITGRVPLICCATLVHTAIFVTFLAWKPQEGQSYILFIIAVLWGFCDSVWLVQLNAYYGILFPGREEASFASFRLWESVGHIIGYIISPYMRTSQKTYLLLAMMLVGATMYFSVEYKERRRKKLEVHSKEDKGVDNAVFKIAE